MIPRKKRNAGEAETMAAEPKNKISAQKDETQDMLADKAEKKRREDAVRVIRAQQYKQIMEYHGGDSRHIVKHREGEALVFVKWEADIAKVTARYRG